MSKYTAERVYEVIKDFAGYSYTHHGIGGELMAIAEDYAALLSERESAKVHDLVKTGDPDASSTICDRNGEVVLAYCRRCGKGEADLGEICESARAG